MSKITSLIGGTLVGAISISSVEMGNATNELFLNTGMVGISHIADRIFKSGDVDPIYTGLGFCTGRYAAFGVKELIKYL